MSTFGDWKNRTPGFVEADRVALRGRTMEGSFISTLVLTDIASGWTECVPLLVREAHLWSPCARNTDSASHPHPQGPSSVVATRKPLKLYPNPAPPQPR